MAEKKKPALRSTPSIKKTPSLDQFAAAAGKRKIAEEEFYPWEDPRIREDVKKNLPLRLPEPLYMKLKYIADHTPYSMNSFILEKLTEEIEEEIASLLG
ncbi:MAG: putative HicB family RNase H-like nuclease [Desulforhopalus sp.]